MNLLRRVHDKTLSSPVVLGDLAPVVLGYLALVVLGDLAVFVSVATKHISKDVRANICEMLNFSLH
jgi:ABC-type molybdate transport system permease subunit